MQGHSRFKHQIDPWTSVLWIFSPYETVNDSLSRASTVVSSAGRTVLSTANFAIGGGDPGGEDTTEGSCEGWADEYSSLYAH